jgi:hypothetical protein
MGRKKFHGDPRGWTMKGVLNREAEYVSSIADYYELVEAIEAYYRKYQVSYERVTFPFKGPKNIGIISDPTKASEKVFASGAYREK